MIQRLGDVEKVFELSEKSRNYSISRADLLNDADSNSEKKFMLEEEPAISEDEGSDIDLRSIYEKVGIIILTNKRNKNFYSKIPDNENLRDRRKFLSLKFLLNKFFR